MMTLITSSFERLIVPGAKIDSIAGGFEFTEGPVWNSEKQHLIFSDIYGDALYAWSNEGCDVFRRPSGQANGNTYDRQGRLITCEHKNRRVSRTMEDGTVETLADNYEEKRLNSPNDVVCSSAGDIYFTDPPYGLLQPDGSIKNGELDFFGVYRLSPRDNSLTLLIDGSINAGDNLAAAQAQHGSAPDIAGQDKANPTSLILSAAMLLNWLGARHNNKSFNDAATAMDTAIDAVLAEPDKRTADLGGPLGTQAFAAVVAEALKN